MGFQEKMAWAMMLILIVTGVAYYGVIFQAAGALGQFPPPILPLMIGYVVLLVIASIVASILIAVTKPSEASTALDEREKVIQFKGEAWSGRAMGFLILCALLDFGVNGDGNRLFHLVFATMIISQIAEYGLQIFFYRRGV
ncbi:MAG: hypothetical protein NXH88_12820 [Hyphomonas sp.]|nr:hypothetical protein [Hyphomonas sp.]